MVGGWCETRYMPARSFISPEAAVSVSQVPTGALFVADPAGPDTSSTDPRALRRAKIHLAWIGPAVDTSLLLQVHLLGGHRGPGRGTS